MNIDSEPVVLYNRQQINAVVRRLAREITRDYAGKTPLVIGVLKGSFIFVSDLVRKLDFPLEIEFIRLASYGSSQISSGRVSMISDTGISIEGRHVLVVEDIVDTGLSLAFLMDYLSEGKPASVKLCSLLDKPSRRQSDVKISYCGLTVPDKFLVGYGLDCNEQYRNLADICVIEESC